MKAEEIEAALKAFEELLGYIPRGKKAMAFSAASEVELALRKMLQEVRKTEGQG